MSDAAAADSVRLTLHGEPGQVDLVVPRAAPVTEVARAYVEAVQATQMPQLTTTRGQVLDNGRSVRACGLGDGEVLYAGRPPDSPGYLADAGRPAAGRSATSPDAQGSVRRALGLAAVGGAAGAALAAALAPAGTLRSAGAVVLCAAAFVTVLPWRTGRPADRPNPVAPVLAPALAAAGVITGLGHSTAGGALLVVAVAALAAAVTAAVSRALARNDDPRPLVWIVVGSVVAAVAIVILLIGAPPRSLWAVLFAGAVVAARWLPYLVVDVPDQALLDLDRLAITAWSARGRPGSGRRRNLVDPDSVSTLVERGSRLVAASALALGFVLGATAPALASAPGEGITGLATGLLLLFGGGAVTLVSRSYRARRPRVLMRASGGWVLGTLAVFFVGDVSGVLTWALSAVGVGVGALVFFAGVALGRGWRSLWWARVGDIVDATCVVVAVAMVPVAAGLFDVARQLGS
ncbi:MAG: EsaB/YukD family protein [Nocardioidaceae bacterium]